jgi:hypothetical protein
MAAARRLVRPETPARMRLAVVLTITVALALLATASLVMARTQEQVRVIGEVAAPQAATAADLYFALSDLDAQVARMVLIGDDDALAGSRLDALAAYRERSRQVDADIERLLAMSAAGTERSTVVRLLDDLAVYRERVWQALTAGDAAPGYYTQATTVLHGDLLPGARRLREGSEQRLADAYGARSATETLGVTLMVLLGGTLVVLLVALQVWLARRFRRTLNPALLAATALTVALVIPAVTVLGAQGDRLAAARDESLRPFLALSEARAVSYDAAADTSRYLISDNLAYYAQDFTAKDGCLAAGGSCGRGGETIDGGLPAGGAADRWAAYRRGHERIVALASAGRRAEAIGALTGIRRGDAAFDFSYYDAAVAAIADERKAAFDAALRDARRLLTGWVVLPVAVLALVVLLVPLSVRRRFAEYR